ncbi:methionine aminopeptidase [Austwickia chelonae]|uniref:methionine aminopeptidase n=1 Tax=Austwickia chelonae TaxID=100225 RepID=UPI000E2329CB|nr:methionine aminopeptidase [Austwickia chelonae]
MSYWYNLRTGQVEQDPNTSRKADLMGPYGDAQSAARALEKARERTAAWDEEDRRAAERDGEEGPEGLLGKLWR